MKTVATKKIKSKLLRVRVTAWEFHRIRMLAKLYAAGNVSVWMRYAGINVRRKFLTKGRELLR